MPGWLCLIGAAQQPEALIEAIQYTLRAHEGNAGRGQLDGQRDAIQPPAQTDDCLQIAVVQGEAAVDRMSLVHQQGDGAVRHGLILSRADFRH